MPASQSERRYPKLSEAELGNFLKDWKKELEQGLLSPSVKPSFLGIDPVWFVGSQHTFEGNPLPEFCSISRNILDCFATALLSTPDVEFPASPLVVRCRLGEERKNLRLYLIAMLAVGEQILPLELKEEWEVWIASKLRPLAKVKEIALANIFWDRTRRHSGIRSSSLTIPVKWFATRSPDWEHLRENGKPCWPECELLVDPVTATLRETARRAIDFVESTTESPIK
jgi:hypothetical protein